MKNTLLTVVFAILAIFLTVACGGKKIVPSSSCDSPCGGDGAGCGKCAQEQLADLQNFLARKQNEIDQLQRHLRELQRPGRNTVPAAPTPVQPVTATPSDCTPGGAPATK